MPADASAEDLREELEALLHREKIPAALQAKILAGADAYARAVRADARKKPAEPVRPPAVHYALACRGYPACRPHSPLSAGNWAVSGDVEAVTCGHCRKILARGEAS
jgi:hypothetical protein